jgi:hypothetical protein
MQKWYMALAKTFDCVFLETRIEKSSGSRPRKTRMDGQDYTWFLVNQPYMMEAWPIAVIQELNEYLW